MTVCTGAEDLHHGMARLLLYRERVPKYSTTPCIHAQACTVVVLDLLSKHKVTKHPLHPNAAQGCRGEPDTDAVSTRQTLPGGGRGQYKLQPFPSIKAPETGRNGARTETQQAHMRTQHSEYTHRVGIA